jgi:peptide/nickel transport system substrate-binding protein
VGTGPYLFDPKAWIKGQQITMLRNPNYWGERPTFDRLIYRFIPNPQAGLQALQEGQIDFMTPLPDQFQKFVKDPEFTKRFLTYKYQTPTSGYLYVGYNLRKPMFQDKLTRQALTQLLDRDAINQTIGQGLWFTVTGPFSPITPQSDAHVKPWPYSIEEAKKKLAEAGWKMGSAGVLERNGTAFKFNIMIPSQISTYEQIAAYIKEQFKKVGIDATIQPFEFSVLVDRLDTRQFDVSILRWGGGGAEQDPYQIWDSASIAGKGSNYIGFNNPEADRLIETARREMDPEKRQALWHQFHDLLHDLQPDTVLSASYNLTFIDKRLQNTEPYKSGLNSGDWYVPAARQKYH